MNFEIIAMIIGAFYCANVAYNIFQNERDRKIRLEFTERRLRAEEKFNADQSGPAKKMAESVERLSKR